MTAPRPAPQSGTAGEPKRKEVRLGDQQCPRCRETFTVSYWSGDVLVQARCLSCELKWPLPRVV